MPIRELVEILDKLCDLNQQYAINIIGIQEDEITVCLKRRTKNYDTCKEEQDEQHRID